MKLKLLLKGISLALLSTFVCANDCDELKSYISNNKIAYENAIKECTVDENGKVINM